MRDEKVVIFKSTFISNYIVSIPNNRNEWKSDSLFICKIKPTKLHRLKLEYS